MRTVDWAAVCNIRRSVIRVIIIVYGHGNDVWRKKGQEAIDVKLSATRCLVSTAVTAVCFRSLGRHRLNENSIPPRRRSIASPRREGGANG